MRELIRHGENGLLVDFFDGQQQLETVLSVLDRPQDYAGIRASARETIVSSYSIQKGIDRYLQLMGLGS